MNRSKKTTTAKRGAKKRTKAEKTPKPEPVNPPKNRRVWGPSAKTLSILLDGSKNISLADRRTFDHLMRLNIALQIFFGQDKQTAALFLFSVWMDSYCSGSVWDAHRASPDLEEELKRFERDVIAATRPKRTRGRKKDPSVTTGRELRAQGLSIGRICETVFPDWDKHPKWVQQRMKRGLDDAIRKREKADQGETIDAEK